MSRNKFIEYQAKAYALKRWTKPKYLAIRIIEERFPNRKKGDTKLIYDVNNALFGKSYVKAVELGLIPIINKLYKQSQKYVTKNKR